MSTPTPTLADLRARVLAGHVLTDDEVLHVVRRLRDDRAAAVQRAATKAASKHVDMDQLFAAGTAQPAQSAPAATPPKDPFR